MCSSYTAHHVSWQSAFTCQYSSTAIIVFGEKSAICIEQIVPVRAPELWSFPKIYQLETPRRWWHSRPSNVNHRQAVSTECGSSVLLHPHWHAVWAVLGSYYHIQGRVRLLRPPPLQIWPLCWVSHIPKHAMFRALAIATTVTILTILHSYVSAQAATCLSQLEFNWVRRQLERKCIYFFIWLL